MAGTLALTATLTAAGLGTAVADQQGSPSADSSVSANNAQQWAQQYPDQYWSYVDSEFAAYPGDGIRHGHAGSLWDVTHAGNWSAGCLACHSSSMGELVEQYGDQFLTVNTVSPGRYGHTGLPQEQIEAQLDENAFDRFDARRAVTTGITCYQCHGDTPGALVVANSWTREAAEQGGFDLDNPDLVCAQCHSMPDYSNLLLSTDSSTWYMLRAGNDPDAIYNEFLSEGVVDPRFSNEALEFNQFYGSIMDLAGADCADCHTQKATNEAGESYTVHAFLDPGTNQVLYENCSQCHEDSAEERYAAVLEVQADYDQRAQSALDAVENFRAALDAADGQNDETLAEATALYYRALFYYNYGRETAQGVHSIGNTTTSTCFEKAQATVEQGMALLK